MTSMLTLNLPRLDISRPFWLFAKSVRVFNRTGLMIYKSSWLRDDEDWLEEAFDFIKEQKFSFVRKGIFVDVTMMFEEGEWAIYLGPAKGNEPLTQEELEGLESEARKIVKEMVSAVN